MNHSYPRVTARYEQTTAPDAATRCCQGGERLPSARLRIVHDAAEKRLELRAALEAMSHQVVPEAGDAETARRLARQLRPDLILLPTSLREQDSFAAAEAIRRESD